MNNKLTTLTEPVMLGGQETTILANFQRKDPEGHTATPTFRAIHDNAPFSQYSVLIWNDAGDTASFQISAEDFRFLRGQKDRPDDVHPTATRS